MVLLFESGNDLSSQHLSASTFGVRKLNFCVRYGNRWILSAIITAMVISSWGYPKEYIQIVFGVLSSALLRFSFRLLISVSEDLQLHSNLSNSFRTSAWLVKIIDFCEKISFRFFLVSFHLFV